MKHRKYITHHGYNEVAMSGEKKTIPFGTELICKEDNILYTKDNKPVCYSTSENAKKHFAQNDDGHGLERGRITYGVAYSDRPRKSEIMGRIQRFTDEEILMLTKEYKKWLRDDVTTIIFNNEFFEADIKELKGLADRLDI